MKKKRKGKRKEKKREKEKKRKAYFEYICFWRRRHGKLSSRACQIGLEAKNIILHVEAKGQSIIYKKFADCNSPKRNASQVVQYTDRQILLMQSENMPWKQL